jgi:hypothetical protein
MDYCQKLACFTNLGGHVMEAITWRVSCEFTKFQVAYVHLDRDAPYLQVAILHTQQLMDKLTK